MDSHAAKKSRMPGYYQAMGIPLYWMDEQSGELKNAINAYLDHQIKGAAVTDGQIELIRDFLEYYVNAPCWQGEEELAYLRLAVREVRSAKAIAEWIDKAKALGMDPL
jgi:hypothetical protein